MKAHPTSSSSGARASSSGYRRRDPAHTECIGMRIALTLKLYSGPIATAHMQMRIVVAGFCLAQRSRLHNYDSSSTARIASHVTVDVAVALQAFRARSQRDLLHCRVGDCEDSSFLTMHTIHRYLIACMRVSTLPHICFAAAHCTCVVRSVP